MPLAASDSAPLLTREQVLRALRQVAREGRPLPPGTVYELVYRGRRYPPRAVAELAYRLAIGNPAAHWPRPAGAPTNALLESLDFTISTKRPVLTAGSGPDGEEVARQQAEDLYTGLAKNTGTPPAHLAEPAPTYAAPAYSRTEALAELFITETALDAALAGLARRRNLLLQGPPGTGKTFLARRLAWLLLEADKRGPAHALRLPYAPPDAPRFFVPDNLYVIGTLNLADRSLSPLDYALRRRFAFVALGPQFGAPLRRQLAARRVPADLIEQLCTRMTALNQTITDDPELGADFAVGHSYFCQPPEPPEPPAAWLRLIFEQEIGPLLTDYWREQPATATAQLRKLLG